MDSIKKDDPHFRIYLNIIDDPHFQVLPPYAKYVYMCLCKYKNTHNNTCYPSIKTLSEFTGLTKEKVIESIRYLVMSGFILKDYSREGKRNLCIYTILKNPVSPGKAFFEILRLDAIEKDKKRKRVAKAREAKKAKKQKKDKNILLFRNSK